MHRGLRVDGRERANLASSQLRSDRTGQTQPPESAENPGQFTCSQRGILECPQYCVDSRLAARTLRLEPGENVDIQSQGD
jgi:hypothetical protein